MQNIDVTALEQLGELIGGDPAMLAELVQTFIDEGAEIVTALRTSIPSADLDELRRGAHSLKSSAQDFGATGLATLSATLESRAKSTWPASAATDVEAIASAFDDARQDLMTWLTNDDV